MSIEVISEESGNVITTFDLECNPFKVGEIINIDINNNDKSFWDKQELHCRYSIKSIEHFTRQIYLPNQKHICVFVTSLVVQEYTGI